MKIAFAGTPEFAATALAALHAAGHEIVVVLTQPDRPAGRGMQLHASAVKQFAQQHGLPVLQPPSLKLNGKFPEQALATQQALKSAGYDVMVVAAYGLILPAEVLTLPKFGCLNIHASLLPRWRGAAPIHRAIESGDATTGITIMQMDEGLDTGAMIASEAIPIAVDDTTATLHDKLAHLGATMIVDVVGALSRGPVAAVAQPEAGVTYADKISKEEAALDFQLPAAVLARKIRALNPAPGATALLDGLAIKVWRAEEIASPDALQPGQSTVHHQQLLMGCGDGSALNLLELQKSGGRRLPVSEFLKGFSGKSPQ